MLEAIAGLCHVGIVHGMAFPQVPGKERPVLETIEKILSDDFFGAIEIAPIDDESVRKKAAQMLATSGVDVIVAGQPPLLMGGLNLNAPDKKARAKAIETCKRSVDQAYELGAQIVAVLSGPYAGPDTAAEQTALLVDSLKQICAYAQEKGEDYLLAVALETFDRDIDKKCLIGPTSEAAAVAEKVKAEFSNFGLLIDLSHQPLLGEPLHEMVIQSVDHLILVHIGNCVLNDKSHPAYGDKHPRFGIPGGENGVEQVQKFLEALFYSGYFKKSVPTRKPVISFEVKPMEGETSELVIANAKRTLREAWSAV
jgi:sugar phosphate isomerase/epimerase